MAIRTSETKKSGSRRSARRLESLEPRCMLAVIVELSSQIAAGPDPIGVYSQLRSNVEASALGSEDATCPNKSNSDVAATSDAGDSVNVCTATGEEAAAVCGIGPTESTVGDEGAVAELIIATGDESPELAAAVQVVDVPAVSEDDLAGTNVPPQIEDVFPTKEQPPKSDKPENDDTFIEYLNPEMVWNGDESPPMSDDPATGGESDADVPSPAPTTTGVRANTSTSPLVDLGNGSGGSQPIDLPRLGRIRLRGRSFEEAIQGLIVAMDTGRREASDSGPASTEDAATQSASSSGASRNETAPLDAAFSGFDGSTFSGGLLKRPKRLRSGANR